MCRLMAVPFYFLPSAREEREMKGPGKDHKVGKAREVVQMDLGRRCYNCAEE